MDTILNKALKMDKPNQYINAQTYVWSIEKIENKTIKIAGQL